MNGKKWKSGLGQSEARVFIVDDHPIVRQGLADLINNENGLSVCGQAEDAYRAMEGIRTLEPDVAIVDISLRETNGLDLIRYIKDHCDGMPVLALSMHDEFLYAERALRAGAKGYVNKNEAAENVVSAIKRVLNGQVFVSDKLTARMMGKLVGGSTETAYSIDCLSDRELEVFHLIGHGFGTRQIAEKLFLSVKTIETYRAHIKEKLNLENASELLQYAIQWENG